MTEPATYPEPEDAYDELTYLLQRDAAVPLERQRRVALDGKTYLWVEFKEWYGLDAVRCWNEAGLGLAAVQEQRLKRSSEQHTPNAPGSASAWGGGREWWSAGDVPGSASAWGSGRGWSN